MFKAVPTRLFFIIFKLTKFMPEHVVKTVLNVHKHFEKYISNRNAVFKTTIIIKVKSKITS